MKDLKEIVKKEKCDCCFHLYRGSLLMVVPDGHVVERCCKCFSFKTVHSAHARESWRP